LYYLIMFFDTLDYSGIYVILAYVDA